MKRLLIVDGDAGLRDLLVKYLSEEGVEVTARPDGTAAAEVQGVRSPMDAPLIPPLTP